MGNPSLLSLSITLPPTQGAVDLAIRRLRTECEASPAELRRAMLLYEIADLEERFGDESAAARDALAAVNAAPEFREPLERLLTLVQQRKSHRNRSRLLERLEAVAETPVDRLRALLEKAAHLADNEDDHALARAALEQAAGLPSSDSSVWLALELLAGQLSDADLRLKALAERVRHAEHPTWKALLCIDYAELLHEAGSADLALQALDEAIALESSATARALDAKALLAETEDRTTALWQTLRAQVRLIEQALEDPGVLAKSGLPSHFVQSEVAADLRTRAARALELDGQSAAAAELLADSLKDLPDDLGVLTASLLFAERRADESLIARLSQKLLQRGASGPEAAILWLDVAVAHADAEPDVALDALTQALHFDPDSAPARALELDLLSETGKLPRLGRALAAAGEQLPSESARFRFSLLSADVFARYVGDAAQARAALGRAMRAQSPLTRARFGRMYALLTGEQAWLEEATRELTSTEVPETERASLWFELARASARVGARERTLEALEALSANPESAWLGNTLLAYSPAVGAASSIRALERLATLATDEELGLALEVVRALRLLANKEPDLARSTLVELHQKRPGDPLLAAALSELHREQANHGEAATTLAAVAEEETDGKLAAALFLEAGIEHWRASEREAALTAFERARAQVPESAQALSTFALSIVRPDDIERRLGTAERGPLDLGGVGALDRVALCLTRPNEPGVDLAGTPEDAEDDVLDACQLGSALLYALRNQPDALLAVLSELGERVPSARPLGRLASMRAELASTDFQAGGFEDLERAARGAAEQVPSLALLLEWLSASNLVGRHAPSSSDDEARREAVPSIRSKVAAELEPGPALEMTASAAVSRAILSTDPVPLLSADHPAARLTNLELALPGRGAERRARALAELGPELGDESQLMAKILSGYNSLAAGAAQVALSVFRDCTQAHPREISAWEGLRAASSELGDFANEALACAALGGLVRENAFAAELWERAGLLFLEKIKDPAEAELAFSKAIDRDLTRHMAFDKLFRLVRARSAPKDLLRLIDRGLSVSEDPAEIVKLYWEQARALRGLRDSGGAWAALENVWMLEPDHVGALALAGELLISKGQFADAAGYLSRLARLPEAPNKQRLIGGITAVDLFENKLENPSGALGVLLSLEEANLLTLPARERLAKVAAKCKEWEHATRVLEQLAVEREASEGRAEAARLALVIYRDEIKDPTRALAVTQILLREVPDDVDGLDLVLDEPFDDATNRNLRDLGRQALLAKLREDPIDPERLEILARIAGVEGDSVLAQAAQAAWVLTTGSDDTRALDEFAAEFPTQPEVRIDDGVLAGIVDPEELPGAHALMLALAPTIGEILGPDLDALGISRKHRVVARQGLPIMSEVSAWVGAFGLGEFELYVGGNEPRAIIALASEPMRVVLGDLIEAPLSPPHRARLARELFAVKRGTSALLRRPPTEVDALIVAACTLGEHPVKAPAYALLAEFERLLKGAMPRRVKKLLPDLAREVAASGQEPAAWVNGARRTLERVRAAAVGDATWALSNSDARAGFETLLEDQDSARQLLAFVLSDDYSRFRRALTVRLT